MVEPSDQTLVTAALADRNAYGALVRRHEAKLGRYVGRLLSHRRHATDDVLQEVFIKAYINLNDYDHARPFAPWLYRIAHNEAISHLRKFKAGPQTLSNEDSQLLLEQIADPENPESLFWRERSALHMRQCLEQLDAKYRGVLALRYLEEQSYDAISEILQLPAGTVATYLKRGLQQLREIYEADGCVP
jgi:RNA polymerase sigma-70 factor, ECF subfamily